jgi:hypothetical protein
MVEVRPFPLLFLQFLDKFSQVLPLFNFPFALMKKASNSRFFDFLLNFIYALPNQIMSNIMFGGR